MPDLTTTEAIQKRKSEFIENLKVHPSMNEVIPGFVRPQWTADDLINEYKAWTTGVLDGFDVTITAYRRVLNASDQAHGFALKFLDPKFVCSHGDCDCTEKNSVLRQLEGRLATARGRRKEYEHLEKRLTSQVERYKASQVD